MVLKIRKRKSMPKKVLIYGVDGTGKSTFAEKYCNDNGLNPVGVDIDNTNFTNVPCIEFDRNTHLKVKKQILKFIADAKASEYDTIMIDGVSSLLNLLVSNGKGLNKYGDRTTALNKIINELERSKMNFVLIGQIDLDSTGGDVSTAVVNVNSIVNEKYYCYIDDKGNYCQDVKKFRRLDDVVPSVTAKSRVPEPEVVKDPAEEAKDNTNFFDSSKEIAQRIYNELQHKDETSAKLELMKLKRQGVISDEECFEILEELRRLLG